MATYAISRHNLSDVIILPSGNPPHKNDNELIPTLERYEMCLLATAAYDSLVVDSLAFMAF